MNEVYEQRQKAKERNSKAREVAKRLYPNVNIPEFASTQPSEGGVFVEAIVWVPDVEIEK